MNTKVNSSSDGWTISADLIEKYAVAGPRYTSYPTAVEFSPSFDASAWEQELDRDAISTQSAGSVTPTLSLYFHIPFCYSPCFFCACHKVVPRDRAVVEPYIRAVCREMTAYRSRVKLSAAVEQIHWGGGSPEYLTPDEMILLHTACLEVFSNVTQDADISVELDPRRTNLEQLETLFSLGFRRLSIGVQDFDPSVQQLINRVQSYALTQSVIAAARKIGFRSVNIDLIYGLPAQTVAGFSSTLERILEIRPDRVALYGYAHVTWLKKAQTLLERAHIPSPRERIELFLLAMERLNGAGYVFVGMDHFALPNDELALALADGRLNRNFMGYTTHQGARVLGFGCSAISSLPSAYAQNTKDPEDYLNQVQKRGFGVERGLGRSAEDRMRGEVIESLLCRGGINVSDFEHKWGIDFDETFAGSLRRLDGMVSDRLVDISKERIQLTRQGRLFARNAAMAFDSYLSRHQQSGRRVFSQTV